MFDTTIDIVARTVYGEARNQDRTGQKAVAHVIFNRAAKNYAGGLVAAVCLAPKQFSCWNNGDPNRKLIMGVGPDNKDFRQCMISVLEAMGEPDFTFDSTHYHTAAVSPAWSRDKKPCYVHGDHLFFNDID